MTGRLHVLHVASEVFPFSRTGGLADIMGSLPREVSRLGVDVTVLSPWYRDLRGDPRVVWSLQDATIGEIREDGVRYLFLRLPEFDRPGMYHGDDFFRFARFNQLVFPALEDMGVEFDVLHAHDWAAGILCFFARERGVRSVFTVHNLQYQGRWSGWDGFPATGLPGWTFNADGVEFFGDVNPMKAGLLYGDFVTTVSPSYAHEITTGEFGEGLEGVLRARYAQGSVVGILNGLDQERWDPRTDPHVRPYDDLSGKHVNREALRAELHFDERPVLAMVSRLVEQKGVDLLIEALPALTLDWNVVVLGGGDPRLEGGLREWEGRGVRYVAGMHEALAHRVYAGADAYVMPSRFEPCGLSQMIAMRYGTLPIVRRTGGLRDTVPADVGFVFEEATSIGLTVAAREARELFDDASAWAERVERAMRLDFAWGFAARRYVELYDPQFEFQVPAPAEVSAPAESAVAAEVAGVTVAPLASGPLAPEIAQPVVVEPVIVEAEQAAVIPAEEAAPKKRTPRKKAAVNSSAEGEAAPAKPRAPRRKPPTTEAAPATAGTAEAADAEAPVKRKAAPRRKKEAEPAATQPAEHVSEAPEATAKRARTAAAKGEGTRARSTSRAAAAPAGEEGAQEAPAKKRAPRRKTTAPTE